MRLQLGFSLLLPALVLSSALAATAAVLEGYPSDESIVAGDTLRLHVRCSEPAYRVSIWHMLQAPAQVADAGRFAGRNYPVPAQSWETGCGWPVTCRIPIPAGWRPGAYLARIESGTKWTWIPFIVRSPVPGSTARIAVQLSLNTYQAYNRYGGKSLYGAWQPGLAGRSYRVSFDRPYNFLSTDGSGQFFLWEGPFIAFLEREGIAYEVISNYDVHRFPGLLDAYRVFVSVGHDEYWSKEMYDEVERFANAGGNLAFFSGNVIWWQVRFEDGGRTMVCYKDAALDPYTGVHDERVTVNWQAPPVSRPPARLVGTHYNGSWGIVPGAYRVVDRHHWAYRGVQVDSAQSFGYPMAAYEIDSRNAFSPPVDVIARVELPDRNNGNVLRAADMTYYERTALYGFPNGSGAKIFAGSSVNYVQGIDTSYNLATQLLGSIDPVARAITLNVFDRLACEVSAPRPTVPADGATVHAPRALLQWYPSTTHRGGLAVQYTLFWRTDGAAPESLQTTLSSAWIPVQEGTAYTWWVQSRTDCGALATSAVASFSGTSPADSPPVGDRPRVAARQEGDHAVIQVSLVEAAPVAIRIYSVAGRCVRRLEPGLLSDGTAAIVWDLLDDRRDQVASGLYVVRAQVGEQMAQTRIVVLH